MRDDVGFVHLHVHSAFSLREGAITLAQLAKRAVADKMPALALTDTNNMFGALEFSEKMVAQGVQPIIGLQMSLIFSSEAQSAPRQGPLQDGRSSIVLLAQNEQGYLNLMRLCSQLHLRSASELGPALERGELEGQVAGLIALTGGPAGPLDRALRQGRAEVAEARLQALHRLFGDNLNIELQRHGAGGERQIETALVDLASRHAVGLVATNEPYFGDEADYEAHDALLCIAEGTYVGVEERRRATVQNRFLSRAEMMVKFADLPEALATSVEIAQRCAYRPRVRHPILPRFKRAGGEAVDEVATLQADAQSGLQARLAVLPPAAGLSEKDYAQRLDFELGVIGRMKFPGYFLIVADFIRYAKARHIPVGPGRGSGAGSLVAYALGITDLDPLRFGLLFERFLNEERISMPDFDIDFCQERRDEVIAYVRERYGVDRVAQIITFGSFLARGVMRNVGRVLEMPLGQVDRLAKMVPQNPAKPVTLKEALAGEPRLREAAEAEPRVARMLKIAGTLEGLYSNASTHAAGIVIGDRPLTELVPLYRDPKSDMPATQFNMKWVESAGLVKFDFLGLKTLTMLARAVAMLQQRGVEVDLSRIPLDDAATYALLGRGETVGVFQVESGGMRKALVEMRADRFEDLIALVALYRPGPMDNIPTYCARKLGDEEPEYYHPKIEPVLRETFGVIIYQEQVMQIAQILSGYSLGEADVLRRAMGKKIKSEMDAQRERFVSGALERGLERAQADNIFDLLAKFADYGFNKSHAAAYALISYQTAWLKANHPVEFLAASMSLERSNTDKLAELHNEARRMGISVMAPSVQRSQADFSVLREADGKLAIAYALSAIKGIGEGQAAALVAARGKRGFASLGDCAERAASGAFNRRIIETLASAGAFDEIEPDRALVFDNAERMLQHGLSVAFDQKSGQDGLFVQSEAASLQLGPSKGWAVPERMKREFDAIGFFLSGHPLDDYAGVMARMRLDVFAKFAENVRRGASAGRLAALVLERTERRTKSGSKMGIVTLSDSSGQYEAVLFQEGLNQFRDRLDKGALVIVALQANLEGEDVRARIIEVEPLEAAVAQRQRGMRIFLRDAEAIDHVAAGLAMRRGAEGNGVAGEVSIVVMLGPKRGEVEVKLPGKFSMSVATSGAIRAIPGIVAVEMM